MVEIGITGILILVLLLIILRPAGMHKKQAKPVSSGAVKQENAGNLFSKLEAETKDMELTRDPFSSAPIVPVKGLQSGLQLSGILWDSNAPTAIINGEVVKVGDRVDAKTVIKISQDKVTLYDNDKEIELILGQ